MNAANQALDVTETANTFSNLEKAEMGIYGLVSANGFSEYLTGKDMFGNALTEEQQQNSLYQALGLLAVGGGAYYVNKLQAENAVYQVPRSQVGNGNNLEIGTKGIDNVGKSFSEVRKLNGYADLMSPEDAKRYGQFWDKVDIGMTNEARVATSQMDSSSYVNGILPKKLKEHNLSYDEFTNLRLKPDYTLNDSERLIMQDIRDSVPRPDKNTTLIKNFHERDIQKYLDGDYTSVKGFVAKAEDSSHIHNYSHVRESMRLDYSYYDEYDKKVVIPYPEDGNSYGYIEFKVKNPEMLSPELLEIPYGHNMEKPYNGWEYNEWPWTGNGFTASRNGEVIPEWTLNKFIDLREGAKLHRVVDGEDEVIAIFNGKVFK
jgi:hypothetical protein